MNCLGENSFLGVLYPDAALSGTVYIYNLLCVFLPVGFSILLNYSNTSRTYKCYRISTRGVVLPTSIPRLPAMIRCP